MFTRRRIAAIAILIELVAGVAWAVLRFRSERHAGRAPFGGLRRFLNTRLNPALVDHGIAGGERSEVGVLEHIGRTSGQRYETPVHPTVIGDEMWIPVPYGEASQWARNVLAAGECRVVAHGWRYRLDTPALVPAAESPRVQRPIARGMDWLGMRYLRLHVAEATPVAEATEAPLAA
jgi:deazaflavin-dependent oxidoreductase (nitroreductase family)